MRTTADLIVCSPDDQVQLVVEVKNRKGATDNWAAHMRRNLLAHGLVPSTGFFLLVLPEYFYLWGPGQPAEATPATYKVASREVLNRFLGTTELESLSGESLELLVYSWLSQVISSPLESESLPELSWLFDSGLYERIRDGSIRAESVV